MDKTRAHPLSPSISGRKWWLIPILLVVLAIIGAGAYLAKGAPEAAMHRAEERASESSARVHVEVVKPTRGLLERKTAQAGTVMAGRSRREAGTRRWERQYTPAVGADARRYRVRKVARDSVAVRTRHGVAGYFPTAMNH